MWYKLPESNLYEGGRDGAKNSVRVFAGVNLSFMYGAHEQVTRDMRAFFAQTGVPEKRVVLSRITHGLEVLIADPSRWNHAFDLPVSLPEGDGLYSEASGTFMMIKPADCLVVGMFNTATGQSALVHAGFIGLGNRILLKGLELMGDPANLQVHMGPCIQGDSCVLPQDYPLVGEGWERYTYESGNSEFPKGVRYADFAYDQLIGAGVPESGIVRDLADTYTDERYHSFFRSERQGFPQGRFGILAGILE